MSHTRLQALSVTVCDSTSVSVAKKGNRNEEQRLGLQLQRLQRRHDQLAERVQTLKGKGGEESEGEEAEGEDLSRLLTRQEMQLHWLRHKHGQRVKDTGRVDGAGYDTSASEE